MLVHTVNFGDLEIPEEKIITFKEGLPGFPQVHKFAVLELDDLGPFHYLQALEDPPVALLIINPFLIDPGYEFRLSAVEMEELQTAQSENLTIYAVASIPEDPSQATLNLLAPIVVNEKQRRGKQVILHETRYSVKHPLISLSKSSERDMSGV